MVRIDNIPIPVVKYEIITIIVKQWNTSEHSSCCHSGAMWRRQQKKKKKKKNIVSVPYFLFVRNRKQAYKVRVLTLRCHNSLSLVKHVFEMKKKK